ncbi:hypothetical protein EVAR_76547_1 [Eumeta japonica]|uniref:Pre-C2HC domain-containing protein n=1 Tax=Eumeta variegata TaxID=151549 RepID=A0A4C1T5X1_EUMVA|nr:hypothetical protein EVAR_76547_1 [Eumeta japonica]
MKRRHVVCWCCVQSATNLYLYSAPWRTAGKPNSQDAPASKNSKTAKLSQPTKAANSKVPTAPAVTIDEADVIVPPLRKNPNDRHLLSFTIRADARGLKIQPATVPDFRNLSALLATLKVAYHTYSLKEEREFRVVLRGVPKEIPVEEVKEDLIAQDLLVQSVRRITNRARDPLDLVLVTANTGTDNTTKALILPNQSGMLPYRDKSGAALQKKQTGTMFQLSNLRTLVQKLLSACALRKVPGRLRHCRMHTQVKQTVKQNLSYAKATTGPRKAPSTRLTALRAAENIKALMSMISIIDIGKIVLLANKFKAVANPVKKILILIEHAPLVEAIKK